MGERDPIVRPATTRAMYDREPPSARFVTISGGYHCGFDDSTPFFGSGETPVPSAARRSLAITRELLGDWLDATLLERQVALTPTGIRTVSK